MRFRAVEVPRRLYLSLMDKMEVRPGTFGDATSMLEDV
jgi:hypothetical protein